MTITKTEFNLLAKVLRSKEPVTSAVRLVLIHNQKNADASRQAGVLPQSTHRSVKRFLKLKSDIEKVYGARKKS